MTAAAAFFYLFASITVASGFMVIASRNPVASVLFLILAFVNAAGLFVLMGAEFLAMILVVVYVGAVAVLFLFVVMMLDVDFAELRQGFQQYLPVGGLIGAIFLVELLLVVGSWSIDPGLVQAPLGNVAAAENLTNAQALGRVIYTRIRLLLSARRPDPAGGDDRRDRADAARPAGRQAPEHRGPERPHPGAWRWRPARCPSRQGVEV